MKNLKEYILEGRTKAFTKQDIEKMFGESNVKLAEFVNIFSLDFLSKLTKIYSLTNKTHRDQLFNKFDSFCDKKDIKKDFRKKYLLHSSNGLAALILDNIDMFNDKIEGNHFIKQETKTERELRKWKTTDEYTPLEEYDENNSYTDDEENGRAFVIYYAYDPSDKDSLRVYYINGKTTDPNVKHIQNLHRADWNYETKLGYYHGNTCTVEYYRKSGKDQLIQDYISNDELYDE